MVAPAYAGLVRDIMGHAMGDVVNPSPFLRKVWREGWRHVPRACLYRAAGGLGVTAWRRGLGGAAHA